ncbi:MAG: glycosyltransferase family 4 protein [Chloroflexi bacterium]|nr:glycosyltransferase family 4 protein [Chloroflexota bacterium]
MNICLDLSPVVYRKAGLSTYARQLALHLLPTEGTHQFTAFHYGNTVTEPLTPPLNALPRRVIPWDARRWRMTVALEHLAGLTMDRTFAGIDLFHATEHLLPPLGKIPTVFTFHDAIYALFPAYHLPLNRLFLGLMMPRFLRRADAVIAVSESSKRDAVRLYRIAPDRIRVIYEGVDPLYRPVWDMAKLAEVCRKCALPSAFILFVGTIEPRKNLATLFEAYQQLRRAGYQQKLVVAGRQGWLHQSTFDRLKALGLEHEVIFAGYVASEDLPALYSLATVFAFPSLYEGFGLPPLEAMACGCPVLSSNTSSLPEVCGQAALLVPPTDVQALAQALARMLDDPGLRGDLRARGLAQAGRFTWERTARQTLEVYEYIATQTATRSSEVS